MAKKKREIALEDVQVGDVVLVEHHVRPTMEVRLPYIQKFRGEVIRMSNGLGAHPALTLRPNSDAALPTEAVSVTIRQTETLSTRIFLLRRQQYIEDADYLIESKFSTTSLPPRIWRRGNGGWWTLSGFKHDSESMGTLRVRGRVTVTPIED